MKGFLATVGLPTLRAPAPPGFVLQGRSWRAAVAQVLVSTPFHFGLIALGIVVRVARYASDRSLWLDESYLALNFMNRSYSGLLGTLDFGQGGPAGFLLGEKLVVDVLGDGERALRLLPLVAGVASLFLFYGVARRILNPFALPLALLLFAVGAPFVRYSAELKQYGLDVTVALALLYVFLRTAEHPRLTAAPALALAGAGAGAVWLSHPAVFVLVGVGAGAVAASLECGNRRRLAVLAFPFTAWLASFAAMFLLTLREFGDLASATTSFASDFGNPLRNLYLIFRDHDLQLLHWTADGLAPAVALLGVVMLWAAPRNRPCLIAGGAIVAATLAAGLLGKYPVGQRFILFLLPLAIICFAEGTVRLVQVLPRDAAVAVGLVLAAIAIVLPLKLAVLELVRPPGREEIKPLLAYVGERWEDGDALYIGGGSQYALRYYLECSECPDAVPPALRAALQVRPEQGSRQQTPALVSETPDFVIGPRDRGRLRGRARVWTLFSHYYLRTKEMILEPFEQMGRQVACSPAHGVSFVCLYDLTPPAPRYPPGFECARVGNCTITPRGRVRHAPRRAT